MPMASPKSWPEAVLRNLFAIGMEAKQSTTLIPLSTKRNSPLPGARKKRGIQESEQELKCKNSAKRSKAMCQLTAGFGGFFQHVGQFIAQKPVNRGVEGLGNELQTLHIGQRVPALPITHALTRDVCGGGQLGLRQSSRFPQGADARPDLRCDIHLSPPFHMGQTGKQLLNEPPRPRGNAMRRPLLMPQFYPPLPTGSTIAMQKPLCTRMLSPFPWRLCSL